MIAVVVVVYIFAVSDNMTEAVQCLYMRAAVHELTREFGTSEARYLNVCKQFPSIKENIPRERFDVNA